MTEISDFSAEAEVRERMTPERLVESSGKSKELASVYLKVLREDVPADYHFGSVASIHALKDALVALADQALTEEEQITDEEVALIIEDSYVMDELDHPQVLVGTIALLIRTIHQLKPGLQHSENWVSVEDKELEKDIEARWRGNYA